MYKPDRLKSYEQEARALKNDIIETLKKHPMPALLAVDVLRTICRDIMCYFNTADMKEKYNGTEIIKRITDESDIGGKMNGHRVSWDEVIGN